MGWRIDWTQNGIGGDRRQDEIGWEGRPVFGLLLEMSLPWAFGTGELSPGMAALAGKGTGGKRGTASLPLSICEN